MIGCKNLSKVSMCLSIDKAQMTSLDTTLKLKMQFSIIWALDKTAEMRQLLKMLLYVDGFIMYYWLANTVPVSSVEAFIFQNDRNIG